MEVNRTSKRRRANFARSGNDERRPARRDGNCIMQPRARQYAESPRGRASASRTPGVPPVRSVKHLHGYNERMSVGVINDGLRPEATYRIVSETSRTGLAIFAQSQPIGSKLGPAHPEVCAGASKQAARRTTPQITADLDWAQTRHRSTTASRIVRDGRRAQDSCRHVPFMFSPDSAAGRFRDDDGSKIDRAAIACADANDTALDAEKSHGKDGLRRHRHRSVGSRRQHQNIAVKM